MTESGDKALAFQPVADTAQIVMNYLYNGQPAVNVYYVQKFTPSTFTAADLNDVTSVFCNWEHTSALPIRNAACQFISCKGTDVSTANGPEVINTLHGGESGGQSGKTLPNNVTIAIKLNTANRGKSFRGRTYWIGLDNGQTDSNVIVSGTLTNIIAALNTLLTNLTSHTTSYELGVVSRYANKTKRTSGLFTPATGWNAVDAFLDSQRRRLPAHNRHR